MSEPLKKRLWQAVIQRKIENQAAVLGLTSPSEAAALREMTRWVRSGDPDNVEARAARQDGGGQEGREEDAPGEHGESFMVRPLARGKKASATAHRTRRPRGPNSRADLAQRGPAPAVFVAAQPPSRPSSVECATSST